MPYDPRMITRFGILGVAVYPPVYYYWYVNQKFTRSNAFCSRKCVKKRYFQVSVVR